MIDLNKIYNEDCLEGMERIPDKSIDLIICDLPYGTLNKSNHNAKWDCPLPFDRLWGQYNRIIKPNGAVILFGQGMFTSNLMQSNPKKWRYNLIWRKGGRCTGFLNANRSPLREHEDIMVFYNSQPTYNPQMTKCEPHERVHSRGSLNGKNTNRCYGNFKTIPSRIIDEKYPRSILDFKKPHPPIHPTQKPVELIEWLIKTYSNEGETVLDNCMGSGTTAIACMNTGRNFIGFELDKGYFDMINKRIEEHVNINQE